MIGMHLSRPTPDPRPPLVAYEQSPAGVWLPVVAGRSS